MKAKHATLYTAAVAALTIAIAACSSSNCPMSTEVLCNYHFYDSEGNAITYTDTFSVKTLLPGYKQVFTYRKLGYQTLTLDSMSTSLLSQGYTMSQSTVRNDTVLVNKSATRASIQVPMAYFSTRDTLVFDYNSITRKDTVVIEHEPYSYVELPECGSHYFHRLISVKTTDAAIDHIEIANPTVDYEGNENIKIYFNGVAQ